MSKRGFTLLEVILSLALSALVLIAVGMAIDIHLRLLDSGRTTVEEAQLARALLHRIADDLRNAVPCKPPEAGNILTIGGASSGAATEGSSEDGTGGGSGEGTGGMAGGTDLESTGSELPETERTTGLANSTEPPLVPGLYGNACELQVDTSRLPRIDEFNGLTVPGDDAPSVDRVSDVKTVTYFVVNEDQSGMTYGSSSPQTPSGLVRRQWDRATAAWAATDGQLIDTDDAQGPLAPEVAAIEFRYFDGTEWLEAWDSAESGGLPLAVEIGIAIIPARLRNPAESTSRRRTAPAAELDFEDLLVYRLVVRLPTAEEATGGDTGITSGGSGEATGGDLGEEESP